jgi:D-alanyl-D-alanine carboxypeptidase (penicillin-binding protein 5/6)
MANIKKTAFLSILMLALLLFPLQSARAVTAFTNLEASCAILAEEKSGTVLYNNNMNKQHPADALAKVMTLLLAVSACENDIVDANELVEMTETAWFDIGSRSSTQDITPGEEMTLLDLMYCGYVGGANEACNLVAECIAGNVDKFVENMNSRASQLGCKNTNFTNTHGQYNAEQYTTAYDQFLIFREAMSHPLFVEISGTFRHNTDSTDESESRRLTNSNSLLNSSSKYYYRPCISGMTSATYEGGYSFVSYAESDGLSLISVVLGSDVIIFEDQSALMRNLSESRRLFEWGFSGFAWRTVLSPSKLVAKAPVSHGDGADFVNLCPELPITLLLDKDIMDDEFVRNVTIYSVDSGETLYAPVTAGDVLGEVTLTRGGVDYGTVLLVANTNIDLHRFEYIKTQLATALSSTAARAVLAGLLVIIVGYVALVIRYNVLRRKRLRKIAATKKKLLEEARRADPGDSM